MTVWGWHPPLVSPAKYRLAGPRSGTHGGARDGRGNTNHHHACGRLLWAPNAAGRGVAVTSAVTANGRFRSLGFARDDSVGVAPTHFVLPPKCRRAGLRSGTHGGARAGRGYNLHPIRLPRLRSGTAPFVPPAKYRRAGPRSGTHGGARRWVRQTGPTPIRQATPSLHLSKNLHRLS